MGVIFLALIVLGALVTRSVYQMGVRAGLAVARAEDTLRRSLDMLQEAEMTIRSHQAPADAGKGVH